MIDIKPADIAALKASGADRFDPPRFRYIESMAGRALAHRDTVRQILAAKVLAALDRYQADRAAAREEAEAEAARITARRPDLAEEAQVLLRAGEFQRIRRLSNCPGQSRQGTPLPALTDQINRSGAGRDQRRTGVLEDTLLRQEQALHTTRAGPATRDGNTADAEYARPGDLKSSLRFRQSLSRASAEKTLKQALADVPEDAGPLNPQRLAIHSLAAMAELSPQYLNRFVSYVDTLLWLEQASRHSTATTTGKTGGKPRGKSGGR